MNTSWESDWRVVGTQGTATWDGHDDIRAAVVRKSGDFMSEMKNVKVPVLAKKDRVGGHAGLIEEFLSSVRKGVAPETVCTDNIKSLAMVFGAIESAKRGRQVAIKV